MKKIQTENRIICQNPNSMFNFFGWPTVGRLPDGTLAMVCSGFRLGHICPWGKGVICYSRDEGKTWTKPAVVIDTPEDDRDCGIISFGGKVMMTSFNCGFTTETCKEWYDDDHYKMPLSSGYLSQLDLEEVDKQFYGPVFKLSDDGYEFGELQHGKVQTPHGPCLMPDGKLFFAGNEFGENCWIPGVACYTYDTESQFTYVSTIQDPTGTVEYNEPHAIVLEDRILVHIRAEENFQILQSESFDGGKTFTVPHKLIDHGSPPHLMRHSSGVLVCSYGYRKKPYGQRVMLSYDNGETWETDYILRDDGHDGDLGYPATVELKDGSLLTVYYQKPDGLDNAVIMQSIWRLPERE